VSFPYFRKKEVYEVKWFHEEVALITEMDIGCVIFDAVLVCTGAGFVSPVKAANGFFELVKSVTGWVSPVKLPNGVLLLLFVLVDGTFISFHQVIESNFH
jgi:hypothetical protein